MLLDHLDVDLSTRALESGGNLAAILAQLDVKASTQARLQPWYQANFTTVNKTYIAAAVGPHGTADRWTYTVPASRIAKVMSLTLFMVRDVAPVAAGWVTIYLQIAAGAYMPYLREITATVGVPRATELAEGIMLRAGQTLLAQTTDASNGGSYTYNISANIMQFDI